MGPPAHGINAVCMPGVWTKTMLDVAENDGSRIGHNSVEAGQLTALIERVESVNSEIQEAQEVRKEIFAEAKSSGYDLPTMRAIIKLRAMDPGERHEAEIILDLYKSAMGIV